MKKVVFGSKQKVLLILLLFLIISFYIYKKYESGKRNFNPTKFANEIYNMSQECNKVKNRNGCYSKYAEIIMHKYSFEAVIQAFKDIERSHQTYDCHNFMHIVSRKAFEKGETLSEIFNKCGVVCYHACYHGATIGYLQKNKIYEQDAQKVKKIITDTCNGMVNSSLIQNCSHGIGHALMIIFEGNLEKSLTLCKGSLSQKFREECYGGVFMEYFPSSATSDHFDLKPINYEDLSLCESQNKEYQESCYLFLANHMLSFSKETKDIQKNAEICMRYPEEYRSGCFKIIGVWAKEIYKNKENLEEICNLAPSQNLKEACVRGMVISYGDRYGGNKEKMFKVFSFCEIFNAAYRQACIDESVKQLKFWFTDQNDRVEGCAKLSNLTERQFCLKKISSSKTGKAKQN